MPRARVLLLFFVVELGVVSSCAGSPALSEINDPRDDDALSKCRQEGRAARDAGAEPLEAYGAYQRCKQDAGLR